MSLCVCSKDGVRRREEDKKSDTDDELDQPARKQLKSVVEEDKPLLSSYSINLTMTRLVYLTPNGKMM